MVFNYYMFNLERYKIFLSLKNFKERIEFSLAPHFLNEHEIEKKSIIAINSSVGVICVNPNYVKFVKKLIGNKKIKLSTNIGFPWGTHSTEFKVMEAEKALNEGSDQLDMVINTGTLRSGKDKEVFFDIKSIVNIAGPNCIVKVIIETWILNDNEKIRACKLIQEAGAQMVKTTTGVRTQYIKTFCRNKKPKGSDLKDIILLRKTLNPDIKIKASGGIYDIEDIFKMIKAGADHFGLSKGIKLIKDFEYKYKNGIEI